MGFKKNVQALLAQRGWSQRELAAAAVISPGTVGDDRRGPRRLARPAPRERNLSVIASVIPTQAGIHPLPCLFHSSPSQNWTYHFWLELPPDPISILARALDRNTETGILPIAVRKISLSLAYGP
jgi:transcriptional regulator with XRE-family HTH domain